MALAAATTIMISLVILGVFIILIANFNYLADLAKLGVQLRVFLDQDVSPADALSLRDQILDFKELGVHGVRYVTKEETAKEVERSWKMPGLFTETGENPLPDSLLVELERGARIDVLASRINKLPGVDQVVYQDFLKKLMLITQVLWVVGFILIIIVSLGVLYIVINTVRLTVIARRREIEIMKLVGATDWFVRWPFVLEGCLLGLAGAGLATIILSKGYYFLFKTIHELAALPLAPEPRINSLLMLALVPAGVFFGVAGSMLSIKRFLRE